MKMGQTGCSEKLAYKIKTPVNHPEEGIRFSETGESLKSRNFSFDILFHRYYYLV
jgi:hypothetical protein